MIRDFFSDIDIEEPLVDLLKKQETIKEEKLTVDNLQEQLQALKTPKKPFPIDKKLFTTSKGNSYFILDATKLLPKPKTLFGGGLKSKYKKQLEESLYNVTDKTIYDLMEILYLYKQITEEMYPIVIRSSSYPKITPVIAECLDEFFKANNYLIESIHDTVDSSFFGVV